MLRLTTLLCVFSLLACASPPPAPSSCTEDAFRARVEQNLRDGGNADVLEWVGSEWQEDWEITLHTAHQHWEKHCRTLALDADDHRARARETAARYFVLGNAIGAYTHAGLAEYEPDDADLVEPELGDSPAAAAQ